MTSHHPITGEALSGDRYRSILRICRSLEDRIYAAKGGMERGDHGYAIGHLRGARALLLACRFRRDVLDLYHARKVFRHG